MESLPRKSPEKNGTGFDFNSASMTGIMQVGSTLDLPHSRGNECVDSKAASYRIALPFQARMRKRFSRWPGRGGYA